MTVKRWFSAAGLVVAMYASTAAATIINQTLDPVVGSFSGGPFSPVTVGIFSSIPPGESLVSGRLSGFFGNAEGRVTAGVDLYLGDGGNTSNDVFIARCTDVPGDRCLNGITSWLHDLNQVDLLKLSGFTGPLVFSALQTSSGRILLGETTLIGETAGGAPSVPEPGTLVLVGLAVVGFAAARRRRSPA